MQEVDTRTSGLLGDSVAYAAPAALQRSIVVNPSSMLVRTATGSPAPLKIVVTIRRWNMHNTPLRVDIIVNVVMVIT